MNWLTQVSCAPPPVAIGLEADSGLASLIGRSGSWTVDVQANVQANEQLDIAKGFFRSTSVEGDLMDGHRFERGVATDAPILDEVPCWFEARVTDTAARGDHTVYVAEVAEVAEVAGAVGAGARDASRRPPNLRTTGMNHGG